MGRLDAERSIYISHKKTVVVFQLLSAPMVAAIKIRTPDAVTEYTPLVSQKFDLEVTTAIN